MYTDVITYKLAQITTKEELIVEAKHVLNQWMKQQPGFIRWTINQVGEGEYLDIVQWQDEASAKKAEQSMQAEASTLERWFMLYDMQSIQSVGAQCLLDSTL
jgi:hypothetical protein